ncbi:NACHT, LRR and PYD domains-containing protein 12-like [Alosa sapidissima]|uniref:NACHT, LRR and PYD domains-containing protein 12-like n=1 Tax=Alosa sapidissima TaxID=34773 RepID=UPI001C092449|nr:NACHT, LRR and PYD domains-containing protein 12-like [Alosa sapidissima]XP_041918878.1 NACHT, LRR and PYD domains-containing protein 12-like [Alosa sapidissima]XP_041918879.1 NACHT, LRR and PYD domains-containing protein 12-like [Alosa sapidissima]
MEETSSTPNTKSDECVGPGKNFAGRDSSAVQKEEDGSKRSSHSPTPTAKSEECMGQAKTFTGGDSSAGHVQQGASGTQSKRTDKTRQEKDSASEHRWTPEEAEIHEKLRSTLKSKFQQLVEGVPNQGDPRLLQEIYTDLYVTEGGGGGGVSYEHEVRQIERASWRREAQDRPIKCSDIFNRFLEEERRRKEHFLEEERRISEPFHRQHKHLRTTVLTKGVAGIGKTVSVQKFILDWAEGTANQEVHFIFPLPFRELNLMKEEKLSLVDLIQHFFPEIKDSRIFSSSENRVMFIFDGLDECRLPLDFLSNPRCCDVTEPASVDVLLTNLIEGNLLPSALLWITTRPAAANQIPSKCVDQVTEIRGFNDQQKDEYFRKRISDENLASRTVTHLKSSRSLYIMCHIPVFCWITATVVERTSESENVKMPRTLTQMYTHFLIVQTSIKQKYTERKETDEEVIFKLGKLAFQQLEKGNLIFYEEDLRECGIDVTEASVYSGVCTQIFREEAGLYQGRVFSFVHLSIQEFLAALYVFLCFSNRQRNMPDQQQTSQLSALFRAATLHDLHKTAVDLALQSKNGHLDLFLRFLLGLSLESNQNLLKHLLPQSSSQSDSSEQTAQYVKQKIRDQRSSDRDEDEDDSIRDEDVYNSNRDEDVYNSNRRINLFYCLNELNHHAVVEHKMSTDNLHVEMLLPGQWETKKFQFKMSEEQLAEFDLQKYIKTPEEDQTELLSPEEVLQKVLPGVTSALLQGCELTEKSCSYLASALTSLSSRLRLLDLSGNYYLWDSGVELLCSALSHQNCKLEELQLQNCKLTEKSCSYLASALTSLSSKLRLLDLSWNDLQDSGVELLCSALSHQNCKLEELRLQRCFLQQKSCSYLASALTSLSSRLRLLDLSGNHLQDSGVELLCSTLSHQNCKLEELHLQRCFLQQKSCSYLASALTSLSSRLRLLDLSGNHLQDSGVELLCSTLSHQNCKLEELQLQNCKLTEKSCSYLASALTSLSSRLRLLDLSWNDLQDSGVELLCSTLSHQNCKLEELQLQNCKLTKKSCSYLASALTSLSSRLRLLDLRNNMFGFENKLSDSAVEELSALVKDPHCKLEELKVNRCTFRKESPAAAAASTSSSHSDAAELHLRHKAQQDPGAQLLSLDTHKEEHHSDAPQRSCESCAEVPDSSHWVLMKPEVSTEKSVSTYSLSSPAGSYECSESGLRWTCAGPVTLQYCFMDWHAFAEELAHMQSRPAGPLMDIMLMSGELEEIHLPHFLCLGGCEAPVRDAVRVLHGRDSGVCVEECELTRHHARLLHPNLSPLGVIYNLFKSLLSPMRVHSEVLVYQSSTMPVFRTYLLPEDAHLKQLVERDEEKLGGVWRSKPQPVRALQMDGFYSLRTDSSSEIYPEELMLRYSATTPNFFEVYEAAASFHMELFSSADSRGQCVWRAKFQSSDDRAETQEMTRITPTEGRSSSQTVVAPSVSHNQVQRDVNITTHIHVQPSSAVNTDG